MYLSEISDRASRRIDMKPLKRLFTPNLDRLVAAVEAYGFDLRIVGGAVRDVMLGRTPRDIDLATDALPDEIMFILEKHKFPYRTKGIPHGTVKVRFSEEEEYEITSLAYEIEDSCCPEKLIVHSSNSWEGDAKRRDFTVDALSVDLDGHLYDYTGGIADLRQQTVKFIGDPEERIKKDPVLILRFFKLLSMFRNPKFDFSLVPIIRDKAKLLKRLKPKRVAMELSNIQKGPNAERVLKMMDNLGVPQYLADIEAVNECLRQFAMQDAIRFLLEHNPQDIVPALRLVFSTGRIKIVPGQRGDIHAHIYDRIDPRLADQTTQIDGGFFDTRSKRYLSRAQALQRIGAGDSVALRNKQQGVPPESVHPLDVIAPMK